MDLSLDNPFLDGPIDEVLLANAPLVQVLSQIRFPKIPELLSEPNLAPFRSRLKSIYPVFRQDKAFGLVVTDAGISTQHQGEVIWRLHNREDTWKVSVSDSFVALETSRYTTRDEFFERLDEVVRVIAELYEPVLCDRLGIRYINRLEGDRLEALPRYVQPALMAGPLSDPPDGVQLVHSITQSLYQFSDCLLQTRWGFLPPGATLDPTLVPAVGTSWMLDLDVFSSGPDDFDPDRIATLGRRYAERAYRFFRWAVTPTLIDDMGGAL
jgi:uncharacterized protein (TIGR04255 family)